MRPRRLHPVAVGAVLVALLGLGWWLAAPESVGGSTAYLAVRGSSMVPTFRPDDLVVVRRDPPYEPGDVVAYRTPASADPPGGGEPGGDAARPIIVHRVVGVDGGRLVLRGDANDLDDALRPTPDDVLGRHVATLPGVGGVVGDLQGAAGVAAVVAVGLVGWGSVMGGRRRRRAAELPEGAGHGAQPPSPTPPPLPPDATHRHGDPVAELAVRRPGPPWLWGLLAVLVVAAGVVVARSPVSVEEQVGVPWTVRTAFGWDVPATGDLAAVEVYGEDGLRTGDTVFTAVTPQLPVQVTSTLSVPTGATSPADPVMPADADLLSVEASVVSDAGWRRTVTSVAPRPLVDGWAQAEITLDLGEVWSAATGAGSAAGRLGEVRLEVVASTTAADGAVAASAVQAFVLDEVAAEPVPPETLDPGSTGVDPGLPEPDAAEAGDPVIDGAAVDGAVAVDGVVADRRVTPGAASFGPFAVAHTPASVAVALAGASVLVGGVLSLVATARARQRGEASLLVTRHRWSLVPLRSEPAALGAAPTEVASFDALRRVAGVVGQPVGVCSEAGDTSFWVTDGVRAWCYRVAED